MTQQIIPCILAHRVSAGRLDRAHFRVRKIIEAYDRIGGIDDRAQYERAIALLASLREDLLRERRFESELEEELRQADYHRL